MCRWLPKGTFKSRDLQLQMKSIIPQILLANSSEYVTTKVINNNNLPLQRGSRVPNLLVLFPTKEEIVFRIILDIVKDRRTLKVLGHDLR